MTEIPSTLMPGAQPQPTASGSSPAAYDRLLVLIVTVALAGSCFLISAGRGMELGQRAWKPGSVLRVVAELMALQHEYPTRRGIEIKQLVQGLAAPAVLIVAVAGWYVGTRREADVGALEMVGQERSGSPVSASGGSVVAAQMLLVVFVLWMAASALWSPWPAASLGESLQRGMLVVYAIGLGSALSRRGARAACIGLIVVLALTAIVGIWYYYERNPGQRLKFPIGNPIFLAACLIPGMTLATAGLIAGLRRQLQSPSLASVAGEASLSRYTPWGTAGCAWALGAMCWAFYLTDSRGPLVGLACGAGAAAIYGVYLLRLRLIRYGIAGLMVIAALAGTWWLSSQFSVQAAGRGATARLRLYTWEYAVQLFADLPLTGHGQAAYPLLAQGLSNADMERDPIAFSGSIAMHAHNEWLEIAADLGIIGLGLISAVLAITIVSTARVFLRSKELRHRAFLLGLLAALLALVVEEMFSVALRVPGLPLVFYTVLGLTWAMSRDNSAAPIPRGQPVRVCALTVAVVVSAAMLAGAVRDWRGALAHSRMSALAEQREWDAALQRTAPVAMTWRLAVDDRLMAGYETMWTAYLAAQASVAQTQDMVDRLEPERGLPARLVELCAEDSARFLIYQQIVRGVGKKLLYRMPDFPYAAGIVADTLVLQLQMNGVRQRVSLGPLGDRSSIENEMRIWRELEYRSNRLNADAALRLLPLWRDQPVADRIELIRIPLRSGPPFGFQAYEQYGLFRLDLMRDIKSALIQMTADPEFIPAMNELAARAAAGGEGRDPYAPETLRLGAVVKEFQAAFTEAAALASGAAELSEGILDRFPYAVSCALIDQAGYTLLAYPDDGQRAVEVCEQAIEAWPMHRDREQRLRPLRRSLALYQLAAGHEDISRSILTALEPRVSGPELDAMIGSAAAELYETFLPLGAERYPLSMEGWLNRALSLAGNERLIQLRMTAARIYLRTGDDDLAWRHLASLAGEIEDESRFELFFSSLLSEFPDHPLLEKLASQAADLAPLQTRPATRPTVTRPAVVP